MNLSIRSSVSSAAGIVLLVAGSVLTSPARADLFEDIKAHCESKWPTDYEMQEYCVEQQVDGAKRMNSFLKRYNVEALLEDPKEAERLYKEGNAPVVIALNCFDEWEGDFEMIAYCIDQQEKAAKRLGKL